MNQGLLETSPTTHCLLGVFIQDHFLLIRRVQAAATVAGEAHSMSFQKLNLPRIWNINFSLKHCLACGQHNPQYHHEKEKKPYFKPFNHIVFFSFAYLIMNDHIYFCSAL